VAERAGVGRLEGFEEASARLGAGETCPVSTGEGRDVSG
jgi:hypothetical protein